VKEKIKMSKIRQEYHKIRVECDSLEWLYVPDVQYADYGNCRRCLQLIIPYRHKWKEDVRYPLVVYIPGSAWYRQEMYNSIPSYSKLAERGYVTAVVQYRESTIAKHPAQIEDINNAILFLLSKADEFHIDAGKIFIGGNSSGGHAALMTAMLKAHGKISGNYDIKGIIAQSAPTDLLMCAAEEIPDWLPADFQPVKDLLGVDDVLSNEEPARLASCAPYIAKEVEMPDILLLHGTNDEMVSVDQSRTLYNRLKEAGKSVTYYELDGAGHGGPVFWSGEILDVIDAFIKGVL